MGLGVFVSWFFAASLSAAQVSEGLAQAGPKQIVENFYRAYLSHAAYSGKKRPELPFSRSFQRLIAANKKVCSQMAKGEVCGFGADGDIYLDAQDFAEDLTFGKAGGEVAELPSGKIRVRFNIFPEDKEYVQENRREIIYFFIRENEHWVIDDIDYGSHSARRDIQQEMSLFRKNSQKKNSSSNR